MKSDHPDQKVFAEQVGIVVCCYTVQNEAYEVEFLGEDGKSVARQILLPDELEAFNLGARRATPKGSYGIFGIRLEL